MKIIKRVLLGLVVSLTLALGVFVGFNTKSAKAELVDTYQYTNVISGKTYYYPTQATLDWSSYTSHTGYSGLYDLNLNYTLYFSPDDITIKINSVYINNINYSSYTKYYRFYDNNTLVQQSMMISGQPPLSIGKFNGVSRQNRDIRFIMYMDVAGYRYYFGLHFFFNSEYSKPITYYQETFTDQYISNNRFGLNLGSNDDNNFYVEWLLPKPIGDGYNSPSLIVNLNEEADISAAFDRGYKEGKEIGEASGYREGHIDGYSEGVAAAGGEYTFFTLFDAIFAGFFGQFALLLNFEILGVNLYGFLTALMTIAIVLKVLSLIRGNGRSE